MYFDTSGDMQGINTKTGDELIIDFKTREWGSKISKCLGYVKDKNGKKVIEISGSWCDSVFITNLETEEKICMWSQPEIN